MRVAPSPIRSRGSQVSVILGILWVAFAAWAAEPPWHRATTWIAEDGLPNGEVRCLAPARSGGFWVGTAGGLVRFDGLRFIPEPFPEGMLMRHSRVVCVAETPDRQIWVGTEGHLLRGRSGALKVADRDIPVEALRPVHLVVVGEDLWLASTNNSVFRRSSDRWTAVPFPEGLPGRILGLQRDAAGRLWLDTPGGHAFWKDTGWEVTPSSGFARVSGFPDDQGGFVSLEADRYHWFRSDGRVVSPPSRRTPHPHPIRAGAFTREGIWLLTDSVATLEALPVTDPVVRRGAVLATFPVDSPRMARSDTDSNLWLGLDGDGLVRITPQVARKWDSRSGVPSSVRWLGAAEGGRHVVVKPRSEELVFFEVADSPGAGIPGSVRVRKLSTPGLVDQALTFTRSEMWYAAASNVLVHRTLPRDATPPRTNTEPVGKVFALWSLRDGRTVSVAYKAVGFTRGNGVDWWRDPEFGTPRSWCESEDGLHIGTDNGIWKIEDVDARKARRVAVTEPVRTMARDARGRFWVGSFLRTVEVVDPARKGPSVRLENVPEPLVEQIQVDSAGRVWLATQAGLYWAEGDEALANPTGRPGPWRRVSMAVGEFRDAFVEGFPPTSGRAADGSLWFSMYRGAFQVLPDRVGLFSAEPELRLQRIVARGARRDFLPVERLPYDSRSLEVAFQDARMTAPHLATFRVRDAGADWRPIGTQGRWVASFPGTGRHRFEVEMTDHLGRVATGVVQVVVEPPWWRQGWFLALATALLAATAAGIVFALRYRYRLIRAESQRQLLSQRQRIGQDLHDSLGAELARIGYLSGLPTPPGEAIAGGLARMRESLDEIVWAVNPTKDNLESFLSFLGHVSGRMLESTDVRLELQMPETVPAADMPPRVRHNLLLAAREAIANALRHGAPRCVGVRVRLDDGALELEVVDDGRGFDPAATDPNRNGLQNIRRRLEEIGGACRIESSPGAGTRVLCRVGTASFPKQA